MARASVQGAPPPSRLSGVIVDADSGAPLRAVQVAVISSTSAGPPVRRITDAAGRYEATPLAAGTYVVTASMTGYVQATFGRRHQMDVGGTIAIARGEDRNRVDFQLTRESILLGRVTGADGKGLANLVVNVSRPHVLNGQRRLESFGSARSDAQGEYRVGGLLPGDYYVSVSFFEREDSRVAMFAPTYYPGSADIAAATRVRLNAGKAVRIGAVTPLHVPWTTLSGRLKSFDGKQLMRGALIMQPGDPDALSFSPDAVSQMFPDGRFTFDFVVPGHYIVRALGNTGNDQPDLFASWFVNVEGDLIPEQTMTLKPGSDLSGAARFEAHGHRPPADLATIRIHAPLLDATGFGVESETQLQPDATFHLTSVDAGRMLVRIDGLPAPWSLAQVTQGAATSPTIRSTSFRGRRYGTCRSSSRMWSPDSPASCATMRACRS